MKALEPGGAASRSPPAAATCASSPLVRPAGRQVLGAHGDPRGQLWRPLADPTAWTRSTRSSPIPATTRSRTSSPHLPIRIDRYELRDDGGGAGRMARRHRHDARVHHHLADGGFSMEGDGHKYKPWGYAGGSERHTAVAEISCTRPTAGPSRVPSKVPYRQGRRRATTSAPSLDPAAAATGGNPLERDPASPC